MLREALALLEGVVRQDPTTSPAGCVSAPVGRELVDILRWRAPEHAVAIYDVALARLGEIRDSMAIRRNRALILANSSYALRRLNRIAEARGRVEDALAILAEIRDHPSDRVALDGELGSVLQALADQHAHEGDLGEAIRQYEQLLDQVMAARPDVERHLGEAYRLSLLYRDLARLHREAGAAAPADALHTKTHAMWSRWNQSRPGNPFVLRQLATTEADVASGASRAKTPGRPQE